MKSNTLDQAVNVINSFNQQNMGTTINGQSFIPLSYVIIISNGTGVVQVPVQGNTILLDRVDPGCRAIIVADSGDLNKLMYAFYEGYRKPISGISASWYSQSLGTMGIEVGRLAQYARSYLDFIGGEVVIAMSNGTLILGLLIQWK